MFEELLPYKAPNQNRALLEGPGLIEEEEKVSPFVQPGGGGGQMSGLSTQMKRNLPPLIEEEAPEQQPGAANEDLAWSLGLPQLQAMKNQKAARKQYDLLMHNKAAANPFTKLGKRTRGNVQAMYQARAPKVPFLDPLFGTPGDNFRSREKEERRKQELQATGTPIYQEDEKGNQQVTGYTPAKGIWGAMRRFAWRFRNRSRATYDDAPRKMSWMERLFGARRDANKFANSAKGMGITSTKAPHGTSSGWADQLVDNEGDGRDESLPEPLDGPAGNMHQSAQHIVEGNQDKNSDSSEEEEKVPAKKLNLNFYQQAVSNQQKLRNSYLPLDYDKPKANVYGNAHGTIDNNSVDNDDEDFAYAKKAQAFMYDNVRDNDQDEEAQSEGSVDDQGYINKFIMQQMEELKGYN